MIRSLVCAAALLGMSAASQAGELDREAPAAVNTAALNTAALVGGSELDAESPTAAHHRRYWGYGGYPGFYPYSGWGYRSFSYVGFGYSSFYPSFSYYRPAFYSPGPFVAYSGFGYYRPYCW